jgi:FkbM family methyltransferase
MARTSFKVDLVELAVVVFVMLATGWFGGKTWWQHHPSGDGMIQEEQQQLDRWARAYGTHFSRNAEEWIIRDFFHDRRGGFFLDVGAADYKLENNTYYLETGLGWHGIAVDAQQEYAAGYAAHRPQTKFFTFFVSDVSESSVDFYVPQDPFGASEARHVNEPGAGVGRRVSTITLNDLLAREGVEHIDFVSMDIEEAEPKALAGFNLEHYQPALLCVEVHPEVRQHILDYFHRHDYEVVGRYLPSDHLNLYFMPDGAK